MKKMIVLMLTVCLILTASWTALADGVSAAVDEADLINRLRTVQDFKFRNHENGIGEGLAPVYTAPSLDAYRCANGKASYELEGAIAESNYVDDWLLVRYKIDEKYERVGYVEKKYLNDYKSTMPKLEMEYIPLTAAVDIEITDDPGLAFTPFGTIHKGETFYVLMKYTYTGNWYYVECTVEGKTARGFIDRTKTSYYLGGSVLPDENMKVYDLETLGYPEMSPMNTAKIGHVEVISEQRTLAHRDANTSSDQISVAYPGKYYPCYNTAPGRKGEEWYYIWIEEDSEWAWVYSKYCRLVEEKSSYGFNEGKVTGSLKDLVINNGFSNSWGTTESNGQ